MTVGASLGVCLALAALPELPPQFLAVSEFTLAWTHSIEKTRWEEKYRVIFDGKPVLLAQEARVQGSGAGMEPPPDARRRDGWYYYQPPPLPRTPLRLTRSPYTPDYDWCVDKTCLPLRALMPNDGDITLLYPCQQSITADGEPTPPDGQ